ncbi:MAG: AAC(3) family N-acetyltransferase [Actinomycetota bacterium]
MSEADAIASSTQPATVATLRRDLEALGVEQGMTLMVHSSLSRLGFVAGGAHAVVLALLESVGPNGTVMMPTHSAHLSEPSSWTNPPVPEAWWSTLRADVPPYDPVLTPTRGMGAVVECFRHVPGVQRSAHPCVSAAALGPDAAFLVGEHPLDHALGESSPQARLYELDGHVLLLGVDHGNNTSLHLAEYRAVPPGGHPTIDYASMIRAADGTSQWVRYAAIPEDEDDFSDLGEAFASTGDETQGAVGAGIGHLMRARDVVDFGTTWLLQHRHGS